MNIHDGGLVSSWQCVWGFTSSGTSCSSTRLGARGTCYREAYKPHEHSGYLWLAQSSCKHWQNKLFMCPLPIESSQGMRQELCFFPPCLISLSSQVSDWNRASSNLMIICFGCLDQNDNCECCTVMSRQERSEPHVVQAESLSKERDCHLSLKWGTARWGWKNAEPKNKKPGFELDLCILTSSVTRYKLFNSYGPWFFHLQTGSGLISLHILWFWVDISWVLINIRHDLIKIWTKRNHNNMCSTIITVTDYITFVFFSLFIYISTYREIFEIYVFITGISHRLYF